MKDPENTDMEQCYAFKGCTAKSPTVQIKILGGRAPTAHTRRTRDRPSDDDSSDVPRIRAPIRCSLRSHVNRLKDSRVCQ